MIVCIDPLLNPDDLTTIHQLLQQAEFVDGKLTAGTFAKTVKHNDQLKGNTDTAQKVRAMIQEALLNNPLFQAIARPKAMRPLLISRYTPGMAYGWHTDNAVMGDRPLNRSDLSLTVFLSDPSTYEGGELMLDTGVGNQTFKLPAGSAIVYPSTYLHQVTEVTQGVRLAAVTWVCTKPGARQPTTAKSCLTWIRCAGLSSSSTAKPPNLICSAKPTPTCCGSGSKFNPAHFIEWGSAHPPTSDSYSHIYCSTTGLLTMMNLRKLHRKSAPILFLPLFLTAITGVAYRVGRAWFGLPEDVAEFFMTIHEGRFLGAALVPFYVLLVGLGLVGLLVTGIVMFIKRKPAKGQQKKDHRWMHRILAPIAFLPLLLSASTGVAYRLGRAWFGISNEQASVLMNLHQGSYFGAVGRPIYVLLVGLGLVILLITGIQMTPLFRKRRAA
jgi:PKHD-type hydroxylase